VFRVIKDLQLGGRVHTESLDVHWAHNDQGSDILRLIGLEV
jgi:hypothetical protein